MNFRERERDAEFEGRSPVLRFTSAALALRERGRISHLAKQTTSPLERYDSPTYPALPDRKG